MDGKPQPDPWLTIEGLGVDIGRQIQAAATIAVVAEYLSAEHQAAIQKALGPAVAAMEKHVPGAKITLHPKVATGPGPDPSRPGAAG